MPKNNIKNSDVRLFETIRQQVIQFHEDIEVLSKKSPDNPVNKFKLAIINEKIIKANKLLEAEYKPISDFDTFDDTDLPSNSDIVFVLSQYIESFERWRCAHIIYEEHSWRWNTDTVNPIFSDPPSKKYRAEKKL